MAELVKKYRWKKFGKFRTFCAALDPIFIKINQ
jgi:hypothetical protein